MTTPSLVGTGIFDRTAGSGTTKTVSHTLTSPANKVLVFVDDGNNGGGGIVGVTYDGSAMTRLAAANVSSGSYQSAAFYLDSLPAPGAAYNVVVTYTATVTGVNPVVIVLALRDAAAGDPEVFSGTYIGGVDPLTTLAITPVSSAVLVVQAVIGTTSGASLASWSNGQTTVNSQGARVVGTKVGLTPAALMDMNVDLNAANAQGAAFLLAIAGSGGGGGQARRSTSYLKRRRAA